MGVTVSEHKDNKLTDKQKRFCKEYILDWNATRAAIASGYSKKTAGQIGEQNLKKLEIQQEVNKLKSKTSDKLKITHEMLTAEWAKMAFSSISHLHNTWIELEEYEDLKKNNPNALDCIQETFSKTETRNEFNPKTQKKDLEIETKFIKLKLWDKQKALENLGKHVGYYEVDNEQKKQVYQITGMNIK